MAVNNIERLTLMFSFLFWVSVPSMLEKIIYIKSHIILLQSKNIKCIRIITKLRLYSLIIVLCKKWSFHYNFLLTILNSTCNFLKNFLKTWKKIYRLLHVWYGGARDLCQRVTRYCPSLPLKHCNRIFPIFCTLYLK